jgi:proline iminopeptidase
MTSRMNEREGTVEVGGSSMFFLELGEGPPLVQVPGGPGLGHYYLRPHMDRLADRYRLIYYDPLGTGRSPLGPNQMTLAMALDEIGALQNALGIERLNLLGHSIGALVALVYAASHPDSTKSLVLANPAPPFAPDLREAFGAAMAERRTQDDNARMEQIASSEGFAKQDPATLEAFTRLMYLPFFVDRDNAENLELNFTDITSSNLMGSEGRMVAELEALDAEEILSGVTCPTMIVYGEIEPTAHAFLEQLSDGIKRSELVSIRGASHFAYLEHPDAFFNPVLEFLAANAD